MRFIILGAGAVGGVLGGLLWEAGREVLLVARGAHLAALQSRGLTLERPGGPLVLPIPSAAAADVQPGDVVVLAVKSQDTQAALRNVPAGSTIVCAQNGVENEELALAQGPTLGALVWMHAVHLEAGLVSLYSTGSAGVLDLGVWPGSAPVPLAGAIRSAFESAGFESTLREDIRAWKFTKLLCNLPGATALVPGDVPDGLHEALIEEGRAVLQTAGIEHPSVQCLLERCARVVPAKIKGRARPGGSLWQSEQRASGSELEWLAGYVVKLGSSCGVPTPLNAAYLSSPPP